MDKWDLNGDLNHFSSGNIENKSNSQFHLEKNKQACPWNPTLTHGPNRQFLDFENLCKMSLGSYNFS